MIKDVFKVSSVLGYDRPIEPIMLKLVEEVGELSVEVNIENGFVKADKGGEDGILGECNDIINCALDIAFIHLSKQYPDLTPAQLADIIRENQKKKCDKWLRKALFS